MDRPSCFEGLQKGQAFTWHSQCCKWTSSLLIGCSLHNFDVVCQEKRPVIGRRKASRPQPWRRDRVTSRATKSQVLLLWSGGYIWACSWNCDMTKVQPGAREQKGHLPLCLLAFVLVLQSGRTMHSSTLQKTISDQSWLVLEVSSLESCSAQRCILLQNSHSTYLVCRLLLDLGFHCSSAAECLSTRQRLLISSDRYVVAVKDGPIL